MITILNLTKSQILARNLQKSFHKRNRNMLCTLIIDTKL